MRVYMGSDHAGYELKNTLKDFLQSLDYDVVDLGVFSDASVDYPDIAREVSEKIYENPGAFGILLCGSGTGMCMVANKHRGIRAASCTTVQLAHFARAHNDANILCLGGRMIDQPTAEAIAKEFLTVSFEGGRHEGRVHKIMEHDC